MPKTFRALRRAAAADGIRYRRYPAMEPGMRLDPLAELTGQNALVVAAPPTVLAMRNVPWWGVLSSAAAPVLLIGGWTASAALQPGPFDQVTGTISALAGYGAADRWVMTLALLAVGACHVGTGLALRPAAAPGRLLLITGGAATALVAASPLPAGGGGSARHTIAAAAGFISLSCWPALSARREPSVPWPLQPAASAAAAAALLALLVWFGAELNVPGGPVGLAERVLAGAQALWPLAVVLGCRRASRSRASGSRALLPEHNSEV
jgi:hypothetical membrane protein